MTLGYIQGPAGRITALVLFVAGLALPYLVYPVFAIHLACFALVAVGFDLLLGFGGLLSFGQALFWGGGAYTATILSSKFGAPFLVSLGCGVLYAAVLALAVGAISVRRSGIYFAMITLAIAQIQYFLAFQLTDLTGGENGIQVVSRGTLFGLSLENDRVFYYVVLLFVTLGIAFTVRVVGSPFGAVLVAMRENEQRARSIGYDPFRFKLGAFVISGALAGLAGSLFAIGNRLAGLDAVDWHTSGAIVMMTILGGIGTIYGPIVGAALFESLEFFVSKTPIGDKTNIVMGAIFAIVILIARRGIVGEILARASKRAPIVEEEDPPPLLGDREAAAAS
jgi:branched-chain amino acid transport system permease protein